MHGQLKDLAKENFKKRLADLGELDTLQALSRPAKLLCRRPSSSSSVAGDDGCLPAPAPSTAAAAEVAAPPPAPPVIEEVESDSSSSDSVAGLASPYVPPELINGAKVELEIHLETGARGLRLKCNAAGHRKCRTCCSLSLDPLGLGPRYAEVYFGA